MNIYYATSISGKQKKDSEKTNIALINYLKNFGEVLTEHFSNPDIKGKGETELSDKAIHDRDMNWLLSANVIIAEVSNISLGVGYEIGRAVEHNKKILCLRKKSPKRLSAMISGCENLTLKEYSDIAEAKNFVNDFFQQD
jgi:2'-deoxynucleoside 5'-phosphate N-hydrolase